jgi:glycosyltransferase involved in cell wall biosynthesis
MVPGEGSVSRVWIVSELYYPEETSTGYFVTGIAEGLAAELPTGAICSRPTYTSRTLRVPRRETHNGVEIYRFSGTRLDPKRIPSRLLNAATISLAALAEMLMRLRRDDVVVVVTNPPTLPLMARIACRVRGARSVLLVHDVYPEALAAAGMVRGGGAVYRLMERLARVLYRGFDRVVVVGRDMRELVARKIGAEPDALPIIPNWGEVDEIAPRPGPNALRERLGLSEKFVVQYLGNVGRTHGIDALLAAAKALRSDPGIHFLIIGSGSRKRDLDDAVAGGELPNVTVLPSVAAADLPVALNACDVAVVTLLPGMQGVSVPSRLYNILASGKPVIAAADPRSEIALTVVEEGAGWVVPPDDVDALAAAIRAARAGGDALAAMGERARAAAERRFTRQHAVGAWRELLRGLVRT